MVGLDHEAAQEPAPELRALREALGLDEAGQHGVHPDAARPRSSAAVERENASWACFDAA